MFRINHRLLTEGYLRYGVTVSGAKGDSTASSMEKNELSFQNQLQSIFSQQYATQANTLNYLNSKMQSQINNPQGFTAPTLAAMRTSASDDIAQQAQNAQRVTQNQEDVRGGSEALPSGVNQQINAEENTAAGEAEAGAQENITQANAQLQNQNYWNATNVLNGVAAQESPNASGSLFNGAGSTGAGLSEAVTQSNQSQLLGALGGIAGGAGSAFGGALAGGKICYVAASLYGGWNTSETAFIRLWMLAKSPKWFSTFYQKYAERIAPTPVRYLFKPLFDIVLERYA